ncbi:MAG: hypothetical protein ABIB61_02220 [Candidatus Shapirobacteria bacterium]
MHFKLANFSFVLLFLLGVGLRLFALGKIPSGLSWDEASIGYNAWSVLQSGKDEWGEFLPLHFRAFGEWKLPGYIYADAIFIKIFGLNSLAVRLPSILAGIGGAIVFGLIWQKLKGKKTALIASLLFLFSFWSFFLSRAAFEANLGLFLFLAGWCLFLYQRTYLSIIIFVLTLYTYNAFRIITPLFVFWLIFLYRQDIKKAKIYRSLALFAGGSLLLIRFAILNNSALSRFSQVAPEGNMFLVVLRNYLSHFGLEFLVSKGDLNQRHFSQINGQISYLVLILAIFGAFLLWQRLRKFRRRAKTELSVLGLLLISPLPAAITKESPHSLRAIGLLPVFLNLACLGAQYLRSRLVKTKSVWLRAGGCLVLFFLFSQYVLFYQDYFINYSQRSADEWQAGYEQVFLELKEEKRPIYFSTKKIQPYIFDLFYQPRLISGLDYDVAEPSFWHESRLSRIENIYFLNQEEVINKANNKEPGVYVLAVDGQSEGFVLFSF